VAEPTISFASSLTAHLQNLAVADRDAEMLRIRKRQDRAKRTAAAEKAALEDGTDVKVVDAGATRPIDPSSPMTTAAPATPDVAPQVAPDKPISKKERERQAKMGQTEEVLHKNANSTAAMQLGFGKKAKRYSWMNSSSPSNPFAKPPPPQSSSVGPGASVNGVKTGGAEGVGKKQVVERGMQARERRWGGWREDGIEGRGIQMRDWAMVLERDGRDKRALHRCLMNLGIRDEKE